MITTITTTPQQDQRIAAAFGVFLGLSRDASASDVKEWLVQQLRSVVQNYELERDRKALTPTPLDPS